MLKIRASLLDYLPPVIAFIAAAAAVVGLPKWDAKAEGLQKITPLGWTVLVIGTLALLASILVTARNKKDQAKGKQAREQIAAIGRLQLLRAMKHLVHPISSAEIWRGKCEAPATPSDLLDGERRKILSELNLNIASPYGDGSFAEIKWYAMLERAAIEGAKEITTTLQIYSGYLSSEVMDNTTRLLYSDFLRMRLHQMHDIVLANTHGDSKRNVPFFWANDDMHHSPDYEEFWRLLDHAMGLCGAKLTNEGKAKFDRH